MRSRRVPECHRRAGIGFHRRRLSFCRVKNRARFIDGKIDTIQPSEHEQRPISEWLTVGYDEHRWSKALPVNGKPISRCD
jgi:hypothetical protein